MEYFDFSNNKVSNFNLNILEKSTRLKVINGFNNSIFSNGDHEFFINLNIFPNLQSLNFSSNRIECVKIIIDGINENLIYVNLNNNYLKLIDFDILTRLTGLRKFYIKGNKLNENFSCVSNLKLIEIKNYFNSKASFIFEPTFKLRTENGYIKSILIDSNEKKFKQLNNFDWKIIPMFSVITGKNGIGKTSIMKCIKEKLIEFYINPNMDLFDKIKTTPENLLQEYQIDRKFMCAPLLILNTKSVISDDESFEFNKDLRSRFFSEIRGKNRNVVASKYKNIFGNKDEIKHIFIQFFKLSIKIFGI